MIEHVIMYRQHSEDGGSGPPYPQSAYCSCGWETDPHSWPEPLEQECGNHMYEVWLSQQEEPV